MTGKREIKIVCYSFLVTGIKNLLQRWTFNITAKTLHMFISSAKLIVMQSVMQQVMEFNNLEIQTSIEVRLQVVKANRIAGNVTTWQRTCKKSNKIANI